MVELTSKVQSLEAQISTNAASLLSWETRAREAERDLLSASNSLASSNREREEARLKCESLRTRLEKGEEASRGESIESSSTIDSHNVYFPFLVMLSEQTEGFDIDELKITLTLYRFAHLRHRL